MVRLGLALPTLLAAAGSVSAQSKFATGSVLVELEDNESLDNFFNDVSDLAAPKMNLTYSLFKGASVKLHSGEDIEAKTAEIAAMRAVKKAWPVRLYSVPKTEVHWVAKGLDAEVQIMKRQYGENVTDSFSTHLMTQVNMLKADGYTGSGVKIAVIDTGIDYEHPAMGGCFGEGCLVSYGTDLVGDDYTGKNDPVPDDDPIDRCQGHGTHVAGIIAAGVNPYGFTGAAPDVTLGAYKVFGCNGEAGDDVLISAYMQAFEAGSDIITASIGGPSGWSEDPWAVAVQRIVEAGVPCTISAGNDGSNGIFYASTASVGKGITSVASIENTEAPALLVNSTFTVDGVATEDFGWTPGTPDNWSGVKMPLWPVSFNTSDTANGCDPYPEGTPDLSGKVVLVRRGTCTFVQKVTNARAFGAKYVIVYNNAAGTANIQASVDGLVGLAMVTAEQGASWIKLLEAGKEVIIEMLDPKTAGQFLITSPDEVTGGFMSIFTSWGPTFEMELKPQIAAPGGKILSTYPVALGGYAVLSGTSMACPLAAAVVALISQVRGTLDPRVIENALASTAHAQLFNDGKTTYDLLAPVPQQGAGKIQAYAAAYVTNLLSVSSISFNDTANLLETTNFTITNTGDKDVTFRLSNVAAATAYTYNAAGDILPAVFPNTLVAASAKLTFSSDEVTVPAGGETMVTVSVDPPAEPEIEEARLPVYSGYIVMNGTNGENLALPYIGSVGTLHDHQVLESALVGPASDNGPIVVRGGYSYILPPQGSNATNSSEIPMLGINMALGSSFVTAELVSVTGSGNGTNSTTNAGDSLGLIAGMPLKYQPRGQLTDKFIGLMADGAYAPAGTYKMVVRALKILGDKDNEADWETAGTGTFSISYQEGAGGEGSGESDEPEQTITVEPTTAATTTLVGTETPAPTVGTTSDVPTGATVEPTPTP